MLGAKLLAASFSQDKTLTFVGATTAATPSGGSAWSMNIDNLTGGIDTAPKAGDFVLVFYAAASTTNLDLSVTTSGYTETHDLYSNATYDANLSINYKFLSTDETSIDLSSTTSNSNGGAVVVMVWRNVDTTTPFDVTTTTATGIDTTRPNPPSITPVTTGAKIIAVGCGASSGAVDSFSAPTSFTTLYQINATDTNGIRVGAGFRDWTSGAYDPPQWNGETATGDSWIAATLAIRPRQD